MRARVTLKTLQTLFVDVKSPAPLGSTGAVLASLLLEDTRRVAPEDGDEHIVSTAIELKTLIRRKGTVLTGDGGILFRAKAAGLNAILAGEL